MRPTLSIVAFTVLSGTGYGLWFLLGLGLAVYWPTCSPPGWGAVGGISLRVCEYPLLVLYMFAAGFVLVTLGLLCSLGHLGKPGRAWRAFSQWRRSWLSREGVAALLTYAPALVAGGAGMLVPWIDVEVFRWAGIALALGAVMTVYCTAHIYSSLKPIRAWHNRFVTPAYLLLGSYGGLLWLWALATLPPRALSARFHPLEMEAVRAAVIFGAIACLLLKVLYWRHIDRAPLAEAGHATGLDRFGEIRSFEPPHMNENYLLREMGFVLARKHASKLRRIALVAAFAAPALLALVSLAMGAWAPLAAWPALVFGLAGLFVERWLFFAEARHAVVAYYS